MVAVAVRIVDGSQYASQILVRNTRSLIPDLQADLSVVAAVTVAPSVDIDEAERRMIASGIRLLLVTNSEEQIEGIVTARDLLLDAMRLGKIISQDSGETYMLFDLIEEVDERDLPLFGSCWGHQLIARAYVDRPDLILQSTLFEHYGNLVAVRCWPVIEVDHIAYQL